MALDSFVAYEMNNPELFNELKQIGIVFSKNGKECTLSTGEKYEWGWEAGEAIPYLGFDKTHMLGRFLEYFLGCCKSGRFCYYFMQRLTEYGFFESDYDFENNPYEDVNPYSYNEPDFYKHFRMTEKMTAFDGTIKKAFTEGFECDGEVSASRATVKGGIYTICEYEMEIDWLDEEFDFDPLEGFDAFWNIFDDDTKEAFTTVKKWSDGNWVNQ